MASVNKRKWTHNGVTKEAWIVRYVDGRGVYRQKTFPKKKEADLYHNQVEAELARGQHVATRLASDVKDLCGAFMEFQEARRRDGRIGRGAYRTLEVDCRCHIVPGIGDLSATRLAASDIESWYYSMAAQMHPASAKRRVSRLKRILDWGIKREMLFNNPASGVMSELRGVTKEAVRHFSMEQAQRLLMEVGERPERGHHRPQFFLKIAVHLATFCGLRYGEIAGLTVGAIDINEGVIHVRTNLTPFGELKTPKTKASVRTVPMPQHIADMLVLWLRDYHIADDRDLMFLRGTGTVYGHGTFRNMMWLPLLKRAELDGKDSLGRYFGFHALRHFAASWMIENGWSLTDVALVLGHANPNITLQIYTHAVMGRQRNSTAMEALVTKLRPQPVALIAAA